MVYTIYFPNKTGDIGNNIMVGSQGFEGGYGMLYGIRDYSPNEDDLYLLTELENDNRIFKKVQAGWTGGKTIDKYDFWIKYVTFVTIQGKNQTEVNNLIRNYTLNDIKNNYSDNILISEDYEVDFGNGIYKKSKTLFEYWFNDMMGKTLVDNLNSIDNTKCLSAKQGKVLNDMIGSAITYIIGDGS